MMGYEGFDEQIEIVRALKITMVLGEWKTAIVVK